MGQDRGRRSDTYRILHPATRWHGTCIVRGMNEPKAPATPAEWYVESWDGTSENEDYRSFQTASEASAYAHRVFYAHPEAYAYVYACDSKGRYTGVTYGYRH